MGPPLLLLLVLAAPLLSSSGARAPRVAPFPSQRPAAGRPLVMALALVMLITTSGSGVCLAQQTLGRVRELKAEVTRLLAAGGGVTAPLLKDKARDATGSAGKASEAAASVLQVLRAQEEGALSAQEGVGLSTQEGEALSAQEGGRLRAHERDVLSAQEAILEVIARSLVLHAVSLEDQLVLVLATPAALAPWVDLYYARGINVSQALPLACAFSAGTRHAELAALRFFSALGRRCFVRCKLPGGQHPPGSGVTLALLTGGPLPAPTPAHPSPAGRPSAGALLYSEAILGPHNAVLQASGYLDPRKPYPGSSYLGQRMVWESAVQREGVGGSRVNLFLRGVDWKGVRLKKGVLTCVFGPPFLFPPPNWAAPGNNTMNGTANPSDAQSTYSLWNRTGDLRGGVSQWVWRGQAVGPKKPEGYQVVCPYPPESMIQKWQSVNASLASPFRTGWAAWRGPNLGQDGNGAGVSGTVVPVTVQDPLGVLPSSALFLPGRSRGSLEDWLEEGMGGGSSAPTKPTGTSASKGLSGAPVAGGVAEGGRGAGLPAASSRQQLMESQPTGSSDGGKGHWGRGLMGSEGMGGSGQGRQSWWGGGSSQVEESRQGRQSTQVGDSRQVWTSQVGEKRQQQRLVEGGGSRGKGSGQAANKGNNGSPISNTAGGAANNSAGGAASNSISEFTSKKFFLCSCMMSWNIGAFLHEWALYHAWMGVEQIHIYDNNSDDGLQMLAHNLSRTLRRASRLGEAARGGAGEGEAKWFDKWTEEGEAVRVLTRAWPWLKSQSPANVHCLISVAPLCEWVIVEDVDEFLFPNFPRQLKSRPAVDKKRASSGPFYHYWIRQVVDHNRKTRVGSIKVQQLIFGPSGNKCSPRKGVIAGYGCRKRGWTSLKSVVRSDSVLFPGPYSNVHQFSIKGGHAAIAEWGGNAVIFHYREQAWVQHRLKYYRRSAQVNDWMKLKRLKKIPDMPKNWESKSCDGNDSSLADFVRLVFEDNTRSPPLLPWESRPRCMPIH